MSPRQPARGLRKGPRHSGSRPFRDCVPDPGASKRYSCWQGTAPTPRLCRRRANRCAPETACPSGCASSKAVFAQRRGLAAPLSSAVQRNARIPSAFTPHPPSICINPLGRGYVVALTPPADRHRYQAHCERVPTNGPAARSRCTREPPPIPEPAWLHPLDPSSARASHHAFYLPTGTSFPPSSLHLRVSSHKVPSGPGILVHERIGQL